MLFCTRTDPDHEKQPLGVIIEAAERLVGGWDMRTKTDLVGVKYPATGFVYRAHESLDPVMPLDLEDAFSIAFHLSTPGPEKKSVSLLLVWFWSLGNTQPIFYSG